MKSKSLPTWWGNIARGSLLTLLTANFVCAQNFVKNPEFEEPLGSNPSNNWTVVYVYPSGPADFLVAGRTTMASKDISPGTWDGGVGASTNYWSKFGGHFAPNHVGVVHAYFRQIVTGLQPGSNYACSAWMVQFTTSGNANHFPQVYMETIGTGTQSITNSNANARNNPTGWVRCSVTNTANASGQIEIRVHCNQNSPPPYVTASGYGNAWEYRNINAFYDRVSVVPVGQTQYMPPYQIVSAQRTGADISLQWETVMNNRYRIQASTNAADGASWFNIERSPRLDTNVIATGSSYMFKTNVSSLFFYDPSSLSTRPEWRTPYYFDANGPLFFRITSTPFPL